MFQSPSENPRQSVLRSFCDSVFPNRNDSIRRLLIKSAYLLVLLVFLIVSVLLSSVYISERHHSELLAGARNIWTSAAQSGEGAAFEAMKAQNSHFKGWITILGTQPDEPFYQAKDNTYYLTHDNRRNRSDYGALFLSCDNVISSEQTDKNLLIYGQDSRDGSHFGSLKNLRSLPFLKEHSVIELTTENNSSTYQIYAVFVLNAFKSDDNGYIYNIARNQFVDEEDFKNWVNEAKERSLINTTVEVGFEDSILTLVTSADDFPDARLVVMARELSVGEVAGILSDATPNRSVRYPKRWYDERNISEQYTGGNSDVSQY